MNNRIKCRVSEQPLVEVLNFGRQPLGNGFLRKEEFDDEYFFNMKVGFCEKSFMLQLIEQPNPSKMFHSEYPFFSSTSKFMDIHFRKLYEKVINSEFFCSKSPFVVELGCNDGILLKNFSKKGINHLGIEPSTNVAEVAKKNGVNVITEFFNEKLADKIISKQGKADIFLSANVMCHIPSINDVVCGIKKLIKKKGVVIFEDPYLGDIVRKNSYDQIYDEHVFLFSALSVRNLFNKYDMDLIDLEPLKTHGGSMRYFLSNKGEYKISKNVDKVISKEILLGLNRSETFFKLAKRIKKSKEILLDTLQLIKKKGETIAGYAATSKSTTILNYCNIGTDLIDYICDTTPIKHGKFSPGTHIPIVSHDVFKNKYPNYAFLFAWNHMEEIMKKELEFSSRGCKWITHVPDIRII